MDIFGMSVCFLLGGFIGFALQQTLLQDSETENIELKEKILQLELELKNKTEA